MQIRRFVDAQQYPFIVFLDTVTRNGGDMVNIGYSHTLTVERYSEVDADNKLLEALFDAKAIKYKKEKIWLDDEKCFMTTYNFDLFEREVIL